MKDMDDLHFPRGVDAMNVDHASLHDEEALARITLAEEVFVLSRKFLTVENELISGYRRREVLQRSASKQ